MEARLGAVVRLSGRGHTLPGILFSERGTIFWAQDCARNSIAAAKACSISVPEILRWEPGLRRSHRKPSALFRGSLMEEMHMRKALAILATIATVGATAVTAPAEARGIGPGLAFGLAAGALAAGAAGGYGYYGPGYGYYGYPAYYDYGPGPYAYYGGGPYYYRHRYWRHRHYWEPIISFRKITSA